MKIFNHEPKTEPSLGIEVEIPMTQVMERENHTEAKSPITTSNRRWLAQQVFKQHAIYEKYQPLINSAVERGIPLDELEEGVLAEFAHLPTLRPQKLVDEVTTLYDDGLLVQGETYPLHITVGGLNTHDSIDILLRSIEIIGNIPASRLRETFTWNLSGLGGIRARSADVLGLGYRSGVELRTPILQSPDQLATMLRVAKLGGQAIMDNSTKWHHWEVSVLKHLVDSGLPGDPWHHTDTQIWNTYADLLDDAYWRRDAQAIVEDYCHEALETTETTSWLSLPPAFPKYYSPPPSR